MSFIAGSAMTVLVGTARADTTDQVASEDLARADAAQTKADDARARAKELEKMGGSAYKTGLVPNELRTADVAQQKADQARAAATGVEPVTSPAMEDAQTRLTDLKKGGGWAYKSGAIRWAEKDIRALEPPVQTTTTGEEKPVPPDSVKPVEQVEEQQQGANE
jgi:hypothetical protein